VAKVTSSWRVQASLGRPLIGSGFVISGGRIKVGGTRGRRRRALVTLALAMVAALGPIGVGPADSAQAATTSTVLRYLSAVSGLRAVAGVHNKEPLTQPTQYTDAARAVTGRTPGLWGGDFAFGGDADRPAMIAAATRQWQAGSLVTLMWHMCPPTGPASCDWTRDIMGDLTDAQWSELTTDGTALNRTWKSRIDVVVPYLQSLKSAGVEVLWRPDHELNDNWAWWGGRPGASGSRKLYQMTHDYLAGKGLTNLIWVWSVKDVNTAAFADYYPGDAYVDVVGLDSWMQTFPSADTYAKVLAVAHGKPIALTEVSRVPSPYQLSTQPKWAYFMIWSEYLTDPASNTSARLQQSFAANRVLTQGEIKLSSPPTSTVTDTTNLALDQPAYASSTDAAGREAGKAVDGNLSTRWSSRYTDQHWIYTDLGQVSPITSVRLNWETAYAKKYQIQVSDDQNTWTTVYQDDNGNGGVDTISLGGRQARYVKVYAWVRGTQWGYSLWEFAVNTTR
jgi:mannan endo-1,4-beta-mannosidase